MPQGPVVWKTPVVEPRPGVYVIALTEDASEEAVDVEVLPLPLADGKRWIAGQPVIYIGRATRSLHVRLGQFYRHKYGKKAPHRGGQAVIPLKCPLWVHWATTDDPIGAEAAMIEAFRQRVGKLPYANRRR